MSISKDEYSKMADKASPNSPIVLNCVKAFLFGGAICTFGQLLNTIFEKAGHEFEKDQQEECGWEGLERDLGR